jgi:glyoxylase-like metal-dependent hydrolase (beta-lactamase superfamily II)
MPSNQGGTTKCPFVPETKGFFCVSREVENVATAQPVELAPGVFDLQGGSNIGLIVEEDQGLLVDAGLDKDTARQALRVVEAMDVTLAAVFLTHAHADHFGGATYLQRRLNVPLYAPAVEAAMMENPIIEPLYLFSGAAPIEELQHKFTLAPACEIDHVIPFQGTAPESVEIGPFQVEVVPLPGHSLNQVGLAVGSVLFCADAVFPTETLEKHKVIFCVDMDATIDTLERLPTLPYDQFAPGHGPAYAAEEIGSICAANRERMVEVREQVRSALEQGPQETAALVRHVAHHFGLRLRTPTSYFLTRAPVLAALSSLETAGQVTAKMKDNRLLWKMK